MTKAFRIKYDKRLPNWIVDLHVDFASWLAENYTVLHHIEVVLAPTFVIKNQDGTFSFGVFAIDVDDNLFIDLGCGRPRIKGRYPKREDQIYMFLHTFAHEFCHYERWRDGVANTHRGITNQAMAKVRRFLKSGLAKKYF